MIYLIIIIKHGVDQWERIYFTKEGNDVCAVNNVGVTNPHPLLVTEMTEAQIWEHINVNVASTTLMTRMLLPSMKLRGRGAIVNLSSLTAVAGTPYFAVYSATKVGDIICLSMYCSSFQIKIAIK
jgi:short-subunit dehydrogenase